jgi:hypothetical protein
MQIRTVENGRNFGGSHDHNAITAETHVPDSLTESFRRHPNTRRQTG